MAIGRLTSRIIPSTWLEVQEYSKYKIGAEMLPKALVARCSHQDPVRAVAMAARLIRKRNPALASNALVA